MECGCVALTCKRLSDVRREDADVSQPHGSVARGKCVHAAVAGPGVDCFTRRWHQPGTQHLFVVGAWARLKYSA